MYLRTLSISLLRFADLDGRIRSSSWAEHPGWSSLSFTAAGLNCNPGEESSSRSSEWAYTRYDTSLCCDFERMILLLCIIFPVFRHLTSVAGGTFSWVRLHRAVNEGKEEYSLCWFFWNIFFTWYNVSIGQIWRLGRQWIQLNIARQGNDFSILLRSRDGGKFPVLFCSLS